MPLSWRHRRVVNTDTIDTIADGVAGRFPIPEVLEDRDRFHDRRVATVICGGNVEPSDFTRWVAAGGSPVRVRRYGRIGSHRLTQAGDARRVADGLTGAGARCPGRA